MQNVKSIAQLSSKAALVPHITLHFLRHLQELHTIMPRRCHRRMRKVVKKGRRSTCSEIVFDSRHCKGWHDWVGGCGSLVLAVGRYGGGRGKSKAASRGLELRYRRPAYICFQRMQYSTIQSVAGTTILPSDGLYRYIASL